jgi:hypothetical protein
MVNKKKDYSDLEKTHIAVNIATAFLEQLEKANCPSDIAYAACGNAFSRVHVGLGKGKKEFIEIATEMADHLDCD